MADGRHQSVGDNWNGARSRLSPVYFITLTQLAVLLPSSVVIGWAVDSTSAISYAAGAAVSILPQAWFGYLVLGFRRRRSLLRAAKTAYAAQAGKFMLSAAGFAVVFALLRPIDAPVLFAGFITMWVLQVVGSARLMTTGN